MGGAVTPTILLIDTNHVRGIGWVNGHQGLDLAVFVVRTIGDRIVATRGKGTGV